MGIPTKFFIDDDIWHELICNSCHEVLDKPMTLVPCTHTFCSSCIAEHIEATKAATATATAMKAEFATAFRCPVDDRIVTGSQAPSDFLTGLIDNMELRCPFQEAGCEATVNVIMLEHHKNNCVFNPAKTANGPSVCSVTPGCGAMLTVLEREAHNCVEYWKKKAEASAPSALDTHSHSNEDQARSKVKFLFTTLDGTLAEKISKLVLEQLADSNRLPKSVLDFLDFERNLAEKLENSNLVMMEDGRSANWTVSLVQCSHARPALVMGLDFKSFGEHDVHDKTTRPRPRQHIVRIWVRHFVIDINLSFTQD